MKYTSINDATEKAYKYYKNNIKDITYFFDEKINKWIVNNAGYNDDVDAFRHAFVSGLYTFEINKDVANLLGQANELKGRLHNQPKEQRNMDLWNNEVGRKYGTQTTSLDNLGDLLKAALLNGELITTIDQEKDSREYKYIEIPVPIDPNKPVIVLKENETGRNEEFFDLLKGAFMTREEFVLEIQSNNYPGYQIQDLNKIPAPVSKPDGNPDNNLG